MLGIEKMPRNMFSMQQQLLIFFIYQQQFLFHATWATRTTTTTTARTTSPPTPLAVTPLVVVSSSEATLLTRNSFPAQRIQRQQYPRALQRNTTMESFNEVPDALMTSASAEINNDNKIHSHRIIDMQTNCTRDLFEVNIHLNRGFRGLLYAKDFPLECRSRGLGHTNLTLRLPTSGCGVRADISPNDGNIELSVRVMLQMEQKLRQSSDILRTVKCKLPLTAMTMTVTSKEINKQRQSNYRNGRMFNGSRRKSKSSKKQQKDDSNDEKQSQQVEDSEQTQIQTSTVATSTPRVRIWLELGDNDGSGAVEVGQQTTLTVRAIVPGIMGVRIVDCAALDGLGESTQQLLDDRGCPIDEQVMPALQRTSKPAEEGWSKQTEDDLVEKTFTATFPAFKFPDRERLHVSCGVQLCKGECPEVNCRSTDQLILSTDKHLARIEVFNSLAVTAPQIEVDRLHYDRRYNMSVEEYPTYVRRLPADGTLCMSLSKLALAFCILGIIFLVAIIVAICSLIRSRQRRLHHTNALTSNASRIHRTEVCTSMFSSSSGDSTQSARFGSKLFVPYYSTATLPYGRVY